MAKDVLVLDADSGVYACGFMAQRKTWFAKDAEGTVVKTTTGKVAMNKWLKEEGHTQDTFELSFKEDIDSEELCLGNVNGWVENQLKGSGCDRAIVLLTKGGDCFRTHRAVRQRYKGNRMNMDKPHHYDAIRRHMRKHFGAKMYATVEADDMAAILLHKGKSSKGERYVLCAIDKDLDQCEGPRYNPNHNTIDYCEKNDCLPEGVYYQEADEGWYAFYKQMLTGDRVDNIPGLHRIGEKKAEQYLEGCFTPSEMFNVVAELYSQWFADLTEVTPWWAEKDAEGEWKWQDDIAVRFRKERGEGPVPFTWEDCFYEAADLLYMLRTMEDAYEPHDNTFEIRGRTLADGGIVPTSYQGGAWRSLG